MSTKYANDIARIKDVVTAIPDRLDHIDKRLNNLNQELTKQGREAAAARQWRTDHASVHDEINDQLATLGRRVWSLAAGNGALAALAALIGRF